MVNNMNIAVRSAELQDFDDVYHLLKQLWPHKEMNRDTMMAVFSRAVKSPDDFCLCAETTGKIVGFCALYVLHIRNRFWRESKLGFVGELVVEESFRRRGIGTALLNAAAVKAREKGCRVLELDSALEREGAHKFYEKVNFKKRAYLYSKEL